MCSHGMYWVIPIDAGELELLKEEEQKEDWMEAEDDDTVGY